MAGAAFHLIDINDLENKSFLLWGFKIFDDILALVDVGFA